MEKARILTNSLNYIKKNKGLSFACFLFLFFSIWWTTDSPGLSGKPFYGELENVYGLLALFGSICGMFIAKKWGGFKTIMGRAILMFSFGLLAQEFGQLVYGYYNFFEKIAIPYPSLGDVGFYGSILFYIYGALLLAKASGVRIKPASFFQKIHSVLAPVAILILSYSLLLRGYEFDWSDPLKVFLDFAVPFGPNDLYIYCTPHLFFIKRDFRWCNEKKDSTCPSRFTNTIYS